ncbi:MULTISPECIES: hypothetical protein [Thermococcus]|uniref:Uncharacterized protein n=1 Tax=Thermococcus barossii TaxID=54077 RepID=A0A2Z2MG08_9EURY|nr:MULTISPECIES: hypothetical protein [Thermococcus]ASJ04593.1 hypothetical protein A3L01_04115 [Thermococcus barossii]NJE75946.1 hypothetical protein [Thermococcus sp. ES12]
MKIGHHHWLAILSFLLFSIILWDGSSSLLRWAVSEAVLAAMIVSMLFFTGKARSELRRILTVVTITIAGFVSITAIQGWGLTESLKPLFGGLMLYLVLEASVRAFYGFQARRHNL